MIAILATGLSSYPFHVNVLLLVIALCCSIVAKVNTKTYQLSTTPFTSNRIANRFFFIFLTAIAGVAVFSAFKGWRAKQEWDQLRNQLYEPPFVIKKEYDRLDKIFKYDGKFLTQYGLFLSENTPNGEDAAKTLEKAKKYFISKVTIESLAKSYKQTGDYNRAIENYKWLSDYMPNRFGAKLELVKLYNIICDTSNVRKTATILLTMPVKIPSREIDKIKNETKSILDQLP